ncbi:uncharacterized protein LOC102803592 [Saccoglossus kowalevskii]|uniref:Uncharacterized protein LOC102803592 n=1 Tax=Saccoglossus kowalevskii TaxID=10224 RepID=A0ABM0LX96_SACKO|nr:PREDICTED: uncharacterized protein LOC102803592 [Saccoglossus kowalevskii]
MTTVSVNAGTTVGLNQTSINGTETDVSPDSTLIADNGGNSTSVPVEVTGAVDGIDGGLVYSDDIVIMIAIGVGYVIALICFVAIVIVVCHYRSKMKVLGSIRPRNVPVIRKPLTVSKAIQTDSSYLLDETNRTHLPHQPVARKPTVPEEEYDPHQHWSRGIANNNPPNQFRNLPANVLIKQGLYYIY